MLDVQQNMLQVCPKTANKLTFKYAYKNTNKNQIKILVFPLKEKKKSAKTGKKNFGFFFIIYVCV